MRPQLVRLPWRNTMNFKQTDRDLSPTRKPIQLFSVLLFMDMIKGFIMNKNITLKRLKEVLDLNHETGIFTWKISTANYIKVGSVAGSDENGYIVIQIDGKRYKAHRLVWFLEEGYFPEHGLDHKDRVRNHNWRSNLREASTQCNSRNTGNHITNTSGVKGVSWDKALGMWKVSIRNNYKGKHLGYYKSFDNAVCARLAGEQCLDWANCDSSSPAFKYVIENIQRV